MFSVFLGGFFLPEQSESIERNSKIFVQYAADVLQRSFLSGLRATLPGRLSAVNLPFIGTFPQAYSNAIFRGVGRSVYRGVPVFEPSFLNLRFLRIPARAAVAFIQLLRLSRDRRIENVIIYSPYLPFMLAATLYSLADPKVKLTLIVPDLIEFMGGEKGRLRRSVMAVELKLFDLLSRRIDFYVLLTNAMAERLRIEPRKYVVVEGMIEGGSLTDNVEIKGTSRTIAYSGTLDRRYGIIDLLEAFSLIEKSDIRLVICGTGDCDHEIKAAAKRDSRIEFMGRLPLSESRRVQSQAQILVNPRRPEGEFTQYSFPSKTLEYMASGKPVVMHALPGMPDEYRNYVLVPETADAKGLATCLADVISRSDEELQRIGNAAREFVTTRKSPEAQCRRVVQLLLSSSFENFTDGQ